MSTKDRLFLPWLALAAVCTVLMWMWPGAETVPFHLAWIAVALGYGLEAWPWRRTVVAVAAYTVVTGGILTARASSGVIPWGELAEIPMMSTLVLLVVWNVHKRHLAFAALSEMARRDRRQAAQKERLSRMTSHEMRTPATIATGYVELLMEQETDPERCADLRVVHEELGRLVLTSERLMRTIQVYDQDHLDVVDLRAFLDETAVRWGVLASRTWVVEADHVRHSCSVERLRACLDTLLENAVRYTQPGDVVRIIGRVHGDSVLVGVADSGPGMDDSLARALCHGQWGPWGGQGGYVARDPKSQTGLGLTLVREAAVARGGVLVAGRSAEGGALVLIVVPRRVSAARNLDLGASATSPRTRVLA